MTFVQSPIVLPLYRNVLIGGHDDGGRVERSRHSAREHHGHVQSGGRDDVTGSERLADTALVEGWIGPSGEARLVIPRRMPVAQHDQCSPRPTRVCAISR